MNFFSIYGPRVISEDDSDNMEENIPTNISEMVQNILNILSNPPVSNNPPTTSTATTNTNTTNNNNQTRESTFSFTNPISTNTDGISIRELSENTCLEIFKINEDEMVEEGMLHNPQQCAICHSPIENDTIIRKINSCNHIFHPHCVDRWFENNSSCPLCRQIILPRPPSSSNNENVYTIPISFSYI